ncbi:MAG: hypothetical protein Q8O06_06525, partial [Acetobacterium sp.]|nr:hypothetical protein [Acetobacterium sp.]
GEALIAEARLVYVAAQAIATESAATGVTYAGLLDSADCYATSPAPTGPSKAMLDYLGDDVPGIVGANTAATATNAVWVVTTNASGKVLTVDYWKGDYQVTIDKSGASKGAVVTKFR